MLISLLEMCYFEKDLMEWRRWQIDALKNKERCVCFYTIIRDSLCLKVRVVPPKKNVFPCFSLF